MTPAAAEDLGCSNATSGIHDSRTVKVQHQSLGTLVCAMVGTVHTYLLCPTQKVSASNVPRTPDHRMYNGIGQRGTRQ